MSLETERGFWVVYGSAVQGTSSYFSQEDETHFKENQQPSQGAWLQIHHMVQEASRQLE